MRKTIGKRIITIVLAVAMVVTMFVSVFTQAFAYTETTGTVSNDNVKVRESASTTASQVASLKKGDTIDIIGEETDSSGYVWYKIRVNKSEQGYVRSDLVNKAGGSSSSNNTAAEAPKKEEKAAAPAETTVKDIENKAATVAYDNVVIRKGAGKDYDSLAKGTKGDSITLTGEAKGTDGKTWYRISYGDGKEGYIRSDLVDTTGKTQADPAPAPAENKAPAAEEAAPAEEQSEDAESEEGESEDGESEEDSEDSEEDSEEEAAPAVIGDGAYALAYENDTWYLNDYGAGQRVPVKQLIDVANSAPGLAKKANNFKLIAIGLGALAGLLLIAVIVLALKLRDSIYYEDEDEEEEFDRYSDNRRRRARDDEEGDDDRYSRRERSSSDSRAAGRTVTPNRAETSRRADEERVTVRPTEDDRASRASRSSEDRPARSRRDDEYERSSRRPSESRSEDRPSRSSRDSYRDAEPEAPRRRAKNFISDDEDFEFEFLDLDDDK